MVYPIQQHGGKSRACELASNANPVNRVTVLGRPTLRLPGYLGSLSTFQASLLLARLFTAWLISLRVSAVSSSLRLFQQDLTSCCSTSG